MPTIHPGVLLHQKLSGSTRFTFREPELLTSRVRDITGCDLEIEHLNKFVEAAKTKAPKGNQILKPCQVDCNPVAAGWSKAFINAVLDHIEVESDLISEEDFYTLDASVHGDHDFEAYYFSSVARHIPKDGYAIFNPTERHLIGQTIVDLSKLYNQYSEENTLDVSQRKVNQNKLRKEAYELVCDRFGLDKYSSEHISFEHFFSVVLKDELASRGVFLGGFARPICDDETSTSFTLPSLGFTVDNSYEHRDLRLVNGDSVNAEVLTGKKLFGSSDLSVSAAAVAGTRDTVYLVDGIVKTELSGFKLFSDAVRKKPIHDDTFLDFYNRVCVSADAQLTDESKLENNALIFSLGKLCADDSFLSPENYREKQIYHEREHNYHRENIDFLNPLYDQYDSDLATVYVEFRSRVNEFRVSPELRLLSSIRSMVSTTVERNDRHYNLVARYPEELIVRFLIQEVDKDPELFGIDVREPEDVYGLSRNVQICGQLYKVVDKPDRCIEALSTYLTDINTFKVEAEKYFEI